MSKVGRNDSCPCGSGKKYKKCCIDKQLPEINENARKMYLDLWSYEEANKMTTDEIIKKLQDLGVPFDADLFLTDVEGAYSAQQISENWFKIYDLKAKGRDEDFPWFAAWILWERLAPKNILSLEQLDDLINKGIQYATKGDSKSACDIWLDVWETIKFKIKPDSKDLDYLEEQYKHDFFVSNFCQDLEAELYNAGMGDSKYFEKRIKYCREFIYYFPDESELIVHNMKRAVAESFVRLKKFDEAIKELESLIKEYPNNPWSYIEYGDMYLFGDEIIRDSAKAKELFSKALTFAKKEFDKLAIEERLEDIADK